MPGLTAEEARRRLLSVTIARLATVTPEGRPHLVPVTFAAVGADTLVSAVDHKPKRTTALARLANIAANPRVALLADHYDDDWSRLWWARADATATIVTPDVEPDRHARAVAPLVARYHQYAETPPAGPAILLSVERWSGWAASARP